MPVRMLVLVVGVIGIASLAYAGLSSTGRTPVVFHPGHTHEGDVTVDAPSHSGGTDKDGCHNASVPYHCH